jgi:D-alanyl-D-alanine carboxypeptidase/D-alanyl-D-alanine-endopeptidase (penicillin-binding protein 4)
LTKVSQNLHSELMLREVGFVVHGSGTHEAALREMAVFLTETRTLPSEWRSEDGSGLARNDEVTPRALTRLLRYMSLSAQRETWISFFPIGGEDGTLSNRLCCVSDGSRIRAKTGTLARAVALSGYAESRANGRLAFSILVNNFAAPAGETRAWVDKIAMSLVE